MKAIHIIAIFSILSTSIKAQVINNGIDETYIQAINSQMVIGGQIGTFKDAKTLVMETPDFEYTFESNVQPTIGAYFKYKKLPGIKIAFPISSEPDGNQTTTKGFSLGVHFNPVQNIVADFYYSRLSRYNFVPFPEDIATISPFNDVEAKNIAINAYYIFNSQEFSYRNAYCVGQKQIQNAGSWMAGIGLNNTSLKKLNSIIRTNNNESVKQTDFEEISARQVALLFGYLHNWKLGSKGNGFLSLGMFMGPNFHTGQISYLELESAAFSGVNYTSKGLFSIGTRSRKGTQVQFKVFFNDYGYNLPGVDLRNSLLDGELSIVRYLGIQE